MILNSFSEVNASMCPGAFQELNGLTIVVPNEEEAPQPTGVVQQTTFPPLPMPMEPDFVQGDDILMKALQSPLPSLNRSSATDQMNQNDVLRYLNIAPGESDVDTYSKFSDSASSREHCIPSIAPVNYQERKMLSISDVCTPGAIQNEQEPFVTVGTKRKASASNSTSKRCKVTQTSKFCHICVRSGEQVTLVPCANVVGSVCRKAVCQKCFDKHGFAHEWPQACENREIIRQIHAGQLDRLPENVWTCLHCRQICPPSAQCKIYARTNKRRHLILKQRRAEKDRMMARTGLTAKDLKKRSAAAAAAAMQAKVEPPMLTSKPELGMMNGHMGMRESSLGSVNTLPGLADRRLMVPSPIPIADQEHDALHRGPLPQPPRDIGAIPPFPSLTRP